MSVAKLTRAVHDTQVWMPSVLLLLSCCIGTPMSLSVTQTLPSVS
jgi:hypothetical protein